MTQFMQDNCSPEFLASEDGLLLSWAHAHYQREIDLQYESRSKRARDEDFYDGDQFTEDEKDEYAARGQTPRVFNEAKPTIDWILGGESRARMDWRVLPRTDDDVKPAIAKTKLMKYIDDINKAKWQRSQSFKDMVVTGKGWMRVGLEPNVDGDMQITLKHEHWLNMVDDSASRQPDMSDMRYLFCSKVIDSETVCAWFPDKKDQITDEASDHQGLIDEHNNDGVDRTYLTDGNGNMVRQGSMSLGGGSYAGNRKALRVWEMWYRKTEQVEVLRGKGKFNGDLYDQADEHHQYAIAIGEVSVRKVTREQVYTLMFTKMTVLYHQKSPYRHNRFPFVQRVANIKGRDGSVYGTMRSMCDPQADLNLRRNKAAHLLATTSVIMDDGAVDDIRRLEAEVARSDSIIEKKKGYAFELQRGGVLAPQHLQMAEQDSAYMREMSGVTGENRGLNTNATSGIAIQARQEQGTVITSGLADRHSLARQIEGELVLSLIEQFISQPMQFRITGDKLDKHEFVSVNDGSAETDITAAQADFVVSEQDYRQTMRQALAEQMVNVAGTISQHTGNPNLSVALLEMAIELQDIPNKDRYTAMLREAAGLPPADETEEQKAAREQKMQQAQQAQQEQQQAAMQLSAREQAARASEMEARAGEAQARTDKVRADSELQEVLAATAKLTALAKAIETANLANASHGALALADNLITEANGILGLDNDTPEQPESAQPPPQSMPQQVEPQAPPDQSQVSQEQPNEAAFLRPDSLQSQTNQEQPVEEQQ